MSEEKHADVVKRKGWATPYGFVDFREPVTYEEACEVSKLVHDRLMQKKGIKP